MARDQSKPLLLTPGIHGAPYGRRSPAAYGDGGLGPQIFGGDGVLSCQAMVGGKHNDDAVRSHQLEVKIRCVLNDQPTMETQLKRMNSSESCETTTEERGAGKSVRHVLWEPEAGDR